MARRTVRLRLTALYCALFVGSGAALLAITYLLVANLPVLVEHHTVRPGRGSLPALPDLAESAARQRDADLRHLLTRSAVALAIMAVLSVGLGWLMTGRVLRPVRTITAAVRRISATNLHRRLALTGPPDELRALADTFDDLLARLERSFAAQRQFVANASHELRTPLTLQRAHLEAVLSDPAPTEAGWRTACERALAAQAEQERLLAALLTLARSEGGVDRWQPCDLAESARAALAGLDAELRVTAVLEPAPVGGDPRLLDRLVGNLVENAVVHNVAGGRLDVRTGTVAGQAVLSVGNTGPAVPAAEVSRLVRPFQRLGADRTGRGPDRGLGLGLSIVDAVATAHQARLAVVPRAGGGLAVTVTFPPPAS